VKGEKINSPQVTAFFLHCSARFKLKAVPVAFRSRQVQTTLAVVESVATPRALLALRFDGTHMTKSG